MSNPYDHPLYSALRSDYTVCGHGSIRRKCDSCELEIMDEMIWELHNRLNDTNEIEQLTIEVRKLKTINNILVDALQEARAEVIKLREKINHDNLSART